MVPCLHQDNDYIKRKLRVCRDQKCNLLVGAKTVPPGTGLQTIRFPTAQCMTENGNLRDLDLPIAMVPCLHQDNDYIKRKLRVCRAQKCNLLVCAKTVPPVRAFKLYGFLLRSAWPTMEICGIWTCPSPWYRVCTKTMIISKGSYGCVEPKNVIC